MGVCEATAAIPGWGLVLLGTFFFVGRALHAGAFWNPSTWVLGRIGGTFSSVAVFSHLGVYGIAGVANMATSAIAFVLAAGLGAVRVQMQIRADAARQKSPAGKDK